MADTLFGTAPFPRSHTQQETERNGLLEGFKQWDTSCLAPVYADLFYPKWKDFDPANPKQRRRVARIGYMKAAALFVCGAGLFYFKHAILSRAFGYDIDAIDLMNVIEQTKLDLANTAMRIAGTSFLGFSLCSAVISKANRQETEQAYDRLFYPAFHAQGFGGKRPNLANLPPKERQAIRDAIDAELSERSLDDLYRLDFVLFATNATTGKRAPRMPWSSTPTARRKIRRAELLDSAPTV